MFDLFTDGYIEGSVKLIWQKYLVQFLCYINRGDLTLKNKAKIITEIILSVILIFIYYLSFALENYRSAVFILGIIYCVLFGVQLIMSLISLIRVELPWGITITNVWLVLFQNDSINSTYVIVGNPIAAKFVLISVVILALVLISILGICRKSKEKDFQSYIKKYLSYALVSVLFSGGVISFGLFPIVNYSFDTK